MGVAEQTVIVIRTGQVLEILEKITGGEASRSRVGAQIDGYAGGRIDVGQHVDAFAAVERVAIDPGLDGIVPFARVEPGRRSAADHHIVAEA